jgi:hypothetical protein
MSCYRHAFRRLPLLVLAFLGTPTGAGSQTSMSVTAEENFRRDPNGTVLGRLHPGASVTAVGRRGGWVEADLEGWIWLASLEGDRTGELDLVVSAAGGENLRDAPRGRVTGRLGEGALLEELERREQWARVRRRGWIWSASVAESDGAGTAGSAPADALRPPTGAARSSPSATAPAGYTRVGGLESPILTAPGGDTLALAAPRSEVEVVAREGSWARVRVEGWMWLPPSEAAGTETAAAPAALVPSDLEADPQAHVGRVVSWTLQFISLERAEAVRTDFFEGEPFLLSRFGGPEGRFVYVAVPAERLPEVEGLVPLERISVTARIRTGASALTGTPIVDLLALEPARGAR